MKENNPSKRSGAFGSYQVSLYTSMPRRITCIVHVLNHRAIFFLAGSFFQIKRHRTIVGQQFFHVRALWFCARHYRRRNDRDCEGQACECLQVIFATIVMHRISPWTSKSVCCRAKAAGGTKCASWEASRLLFRCPCKAGFNFSHPEKWIYFRKRKS